MKMDLIQPFLNSADTVVAEIMGCNVQITDVSMDRAGSARKALPPWSLSSVKLRAAQFWTWT